MIRNEHVVSDSKEKTRSTKNEDNFTHSFGVMLKKKKENRERFISEGRKRVYSINSKGIR